MSISVVALIFFTFETLLFLGILYIFTIPVAFLTYSKKNKNIQINTSTPENDEDIL